MNTTLNVIDRIKSTHHIKSDYAVAKLLNVSKQSVSYYRNKGSQFDAATAYRAAKLIEMNPTELLASLHKERASNDDEYKMWEKVESECNLVKDVKKQGVIDALTAASKGKTSPAQRQILAKITAQCILCKIDNFEENNTLEPKS